MQVGIDLTGQAKGFVASYTTLDKIEGEVTVQADFDTKFDHVEITFDGEIRDRLLPSSQELIQCQVHPRPH
jgi:hypothetical protein